MASTSVPSAELIAGIDLFSQVDEGTLTLLAGIALRRSPTAGEVVVRQGDRDATLYGVVDGLLQASVQGSDGREIVLSLLHRGNVFGELTLVDQTQRSASVTALRPSELIVFPANRLLSLLQQNPELSLKMLGAVAGLARRLTMRAEELTTLPVPQRLARKLLEIAEICGTVLSPQQVALPASLSQQQLANHVQATRESVNKSLASWLKSEIIQRTHSQLVILDRKRLSQIARGNSAP